MEHAPGNGLTLAALSGARTFLGPALAVRRLGARHRIQQLTTLLSAFEMCVFDKLPGVPARTTTPQLLARAASGAMVAVSLRRLRPNRGIGRTALAGATVAVAAAFATARDLHVRETGARGRRGSCRRDARRARVGTANHVPLWRSGLNPARSSDTKIAGCSQAAKCPPLSSLL